MRSKLNFSHCLIALALTAAVGATQAQNKSLSSMLSSGGKSPQGADASSTIKSAPITSADKDVPGWLRDSERLNSMLGDDAETKIENAKVVRKVETPIPGLDGFVVEADTSTAANPEKKKELFVFYTDKTRRYLVVGLMIDTEKERDLNQLVERFVRGEMADNPAKALRPQDMHALTLQGGKSKAAPLSFVVDLGPEAGKSSFLGVVRLHQAMVASGANPRPVRIVLVSAGKDELSTGAMAMAMGFERVSKDGVAKLVEFAEKGRSAGWLDSKRLSKDASLKQAIGLGIFQIDENSTQALLARLNTLPLVYDGVGDQMKFVTLPSSQADWRALLSK